MCVNVQNFVKIGLSITEIEQFIFFSKWPPSTIMDLWDKFRNDLQKIFGDLSHCAKLGWNCFSNFDNMEV